MNRSFALAPKGLLVAAVLAVASVGAQGEIPAAPEGRTLRGVVFTRRYEPIPGATISIRQTHLGIFWPGGRGGGEAPVQEPTAPLKATTDSQGFFRVENAPAGSLTISVALASGEQGVGTSSRGFPEDRDFLAILVDLPGEPRASPAPPPVRAGQWIAGEPPADFDRLVRFLYLVQREPHYDHAAVLAAFHGMAQRHAGRQFAAVVLYPPEASLDAIRAELPEGMAALVAVDQAVEPGLDIGWTEAFFLAEPRVATRFYFTDRAGSLVFSGQRWEQVHYAQPGLVADLLDAVDVELAVVCPEGRPVAEAIFASDSANFRAYGGAIADGDGRASFRALRPGVGATSFLVAAFHPGRGLYGQTTVEKGKEGGTRQATVRLSPQPPVSGRVVAEDGTPLADAHVHSQVTLMSADGRPLFPFPRTSIVRTDAGGEYRFEWMPPQAAANLRISAEGYHEATIQLGLAPEEALAEARHLPDAALMRADQEALFVVVDMDGNPVGGARVSAAMRSAMTDAQGVATIAGLPDTPVRVNVSGTHSAQAEHGPGRHVMVAVSRDQRLQFELVFRGAEGLPLWKAARWVSGEPAPFDAPPPWLAVVPSKTLGQDGLLRLGERMGEWRRDLADRIPRFALVLPVGISDEDAAAVAQRAEGVSVGLDLPFEAAPTVGYSQLVRSTFARVGTLERTLGLYLRRPAAGRIVTERIFPIGEFEKALDSADTTLRWQAQQMPVGLQEWRIEPTFPDGAPGEEVRVLARIGRGWWNLAPDDRGLFLAVGGPGDALTAVIAWREDGDWVGATAVDADHAGGVVSVPLAKGAVFRGRFVRPDGRPFQGLRVRLGAMQGVFARFTTRHDGFGVATTGPEGEFALRSVPRGMELTLSAQAELSRWSLRTVAPPEGDPPALGDIVLKPSGRTVRGVMAAPSREGIRDATVTLSVQSPQSGTRPPPPMTAPTDAKGRFGFENAPEGRLAISVSMMDAQGRRRNVSPAPLLEGRDFAVRVIDLASDRRRHEHLSMPLFASEWVAGEPPADLDSRVRFFYRVEAERHQDHAAILRAFHEMGQRYAGRRFAAVVIYPAETDPAAIRAELPEGMAALVCVDEPVEEGSGAGWTEAFWLARRQRSVSVFLADRLGETLTTMLSHSPWSESLADPDTIEVALNAVDVELTALDPEGQPVAGARVAACLHSVPQQVRDGVTDEQGRLLLTSLRHHQQDRPFLIVAYHEGRRLGGWAEVMALGQAAPEEITLRLAPQPPVVGRVVNRAGDPMAGVHVRPDLRITDSPYPLRPIPPAVTGPDGAFRFDWFPPRAGARVNVQASGHFADSFVLEPVEEDAESRPIPDVMMYPADQEICFRVVDIEGRAVESVRVHAQGVRSSAPTDAQGVATVSGLPDKLVPVTLHGAGIQFSGANIGGPGRDVLVGFTAEQFLRIQASRFGRDGPPLWRAGRWIQGEPVPFDAGPSWLAVVPSEGLSQADLLRLAGRVAEWRREHGDRIQRFALVLPVGIGEKEAAAVAQRAESVSVGVDLPVVAGAQAGYSQAVRGTFGGRGVLFSAYLHLPVPVPRQRRFIRTVGEHNLFFHAALPAAEQMILEGLRAAEIAAFHAVMRGEDGPPLWRAARWVQGEPVPFGTPPPWLTVVPCEGLSRNDLLRLAERVGEWRRKHALHVRRFAIILPCGIGEEEAAAVARRAEGVSVGVDQPQDGNAQAGYSQGVHSLLCNAGEPFLAFLHLPPPGQRRSIQSYRAGGAVDEALDAVEPNMQRVFERIPPSPEAVLVAMRESGELVREEKDPFAEGRTWLVLRQGLATMAEGKQLQRWDAMLGMAGFRTSGLAFAEKAVYAGTDQGLIAYSRYTGAWSRIAPAGDYDVIAAPVEKLETQEGRIVATFRPEGEAARAYVLEQGVWRKAEGGR